MNFKKLAIVVLTILVNNIGYTNPERAYIIQQQVCTVINPVLLDTYNNTVHKQNTEAKFKRNNYNVNNSRNNNAINQINVTKLLNITSNNSKVGIKSSNNNYYGNILNLNKQLNVSKSSSTTSNDSKEKEDSKQIKEIPWKWVAEKDLSKYHNIAFKKMFSDKYFNGMSYSDFIKNYTVDDITKEQQVVLKKAAKWAAIRVKKDETLEEIMPIKKFLNSMKKKNEFIMLLNRVKEKSDALQSGKRVAFRGVLEKMGMYNGNERDIKTNCFAHRALICSAIAKIIDGFKYILDVNENTGKKIDYLVNSNNDIYEVIYNTKDGEVNLNKIK